MVKSNVDYAVTWPSTEFEKSLDIFWRRLERPRKKTFCRILSYPIGCKKENFERYSCLEFILKNQEQTRRSRFKTLAYSGYHQDAPSKGFFFGSNLRFGGRQSTVTMVFIRCPREDSFPVSRVLGGKFRRLSPFCNILLQDLTPAVTPLRAKITRSVNLLSVVGGKSSYRLI